MNKIKELREKKKVNFSQYHLSALTGIAQNRISLMERGLIKPSMTELEKIAHALNCRVEELYFNGDIKDVTAAN